MGVSWSPLEPDLIRGGCPSDDLHDGPPVVGVGIQLPPDGWYDVQPPRIRLGLDLSGIGARTSVSSHVEGLGSKGGLEMGGVGVHSSGVCVLLCWRTLLGRRRICMNAAH